MKIKKNSMAYLLILIGSFLSCTERNNTVIDLEGTSWYIQHDNGAKEYTEFLFDSIYIMHLLDDSLLQVDYGTYYLFSSQDSICFKSRSGQFNFGFKSDTNSITYKIGKSEKKLSKNFSNISYSNKIEMDNLNIEFKENPDKDWFRVTHLDFIPKRMIINKNKLTIIDEKNDAKINSIPFIKSSIGNVILFNYDFERAIIIDKFNEVDFMIHFIQSSTSEYKLKGSHSMENDEK